MSLGNLKRTLTNLTYRGMGLRVVGGHLTSYPNLNQQSTIVDLGGNLGKFSKAAVEVFKCKVYCIEPNPVIFASIPEISLLEKINAAVSDKGGEMTFYLSNNAEASSFNEKIASVWGISELISVKTYTLGDLKQIFKISNIDLLKVDIEGAELELFESLTDTALQQIAQIAVEFHDYLDPSLLPRTEEAIQRFRSLGFIVVNYSSQSYAAVLLLNSKFINLSFKKRSWLRFHNLLMNIGRKIKA